MSVTDGLPPASVPLALASALATVFIVVAPLAGWLGEG
jgi:hypothetical protein